MHRVLPNPSLLREIFSNITPCPNRVNTKRCSCRAAAQTCRAFSGPALDVLWQDLDSFMPIVLLIPRLKRVTGGDNEEPCVWFADEALKLDDLTTMRAYARRVKRLYLYHSSPSNNNPEMLSRVEPSTMMQLLNLFGPTHPLFPCLRELQIQTKPIRGARMSAISAYLSLFLSPMLQSVSFHFWNHVHVTSVAAPTVSMFLRDLSKHFDGGHPRIDTIHLYLPVSPHDIDSLCSLTCLEELDLGRSFHRSHPDIPTFQELAILDNLRKLTVSINDYIWNPLPPHSVEGIIPCFASLKNLILRSNVRSLASIISSVFLPSLERLDFECAIDEEDDTPDPKDWQKLFQKLVITVPTLRALVLNISYPSDSDSDHSSESSNTEIPPLAWPIFASLLPLPIVELEIREPKVQALSNQHIKGIVLAWPDLEVLHIHTDGLQGNINHNSLITIATKLPKLRSLSISLNLKTLPQDFLSKPPLTVCMLRSICLPESHKTPAVVRLQHPDVDTLYSLAQFLDTLFPHLVDIDIPQLFRFDNVEKRLKGFMSGFKTARSRERVLNARR